MPLDNDAAIMAAFTWLALPAKRLVLAMTVAETRRLNRMLNAAVKKCDDAAGMIGAIPPAHAAERNRVTRMHNDAWRALEELTQAYNGDVEARNAAAEAVVSWEVLTGTDRGDYVG